ncbi:MAG TPA: T9SS type A sorting domain-containing protein, partial [Saprospiraceae bacterium]|nr:T9SS type A sorting domain-containing protein [Saprospiraceae bacterium]
MRKVKYICIIALLLISDYITAQSCETIILDSQQSIDSFNQFYPNCTVINGDLELVGTEIYNTDSLYKIQEILGSLLVNSSSIKRLSGFDSLKVISESLRIKNCPELEKISEFDHLEQLGSFSVDSTYKLKEIYGFKKIKKLGLLNISFNIGLERLVAFDSSTIYSLAIVNNESLVDFELANFTRIPTGDTILFSSLAFLINHNARLKYFSVFAYVQRIQFFEIINNPSLEYLRGFDNVIQINRIEISFNTSLKEIDILNNIENNKDRASLSISQNDSLLYLNIFNKIKKISSLTIAGSPLLKSLGSSFSNIDTMITNTQLGGLELYSNKRLTDISSLENVKYFDRVIISGNMNLADCSIKSICNHVQSGGIIDVDFTNFPGCRSVNQILAKCTVSTSDDHSRDFVIYPNPSYDHISVQQSDTFVKSPTVAKIYDIAGKEIMRKTIDWSGIGDGFTINISHLPSGSYQ